jgi:hypothetical protein
MYERVIPRDLFNEGSLLKCYGRLYILLEGNPNAKYPVDSISEFDIVQRQDDGSLFIENLPFVIGRDEYRLTRPLNSRGAWPLYAERIGNDDFEAVSVFTDEGDLTLEMKALIEAAS